MITRNIYSTVAKALKRFPAVAILGPRQVGKTTLVKQVSKSLKGEVLFLDLEKDSDYNKLNRDAEDFLSQYVKSTVVLDEIQRMPSLFVLLRPLIDENRKPARYLITGSASPELLKGATESLAGRISYLHLYPINVMELPEKISIHQHWLRGGFPVALTAKSNDFAFDWLGNFITNYIERDLPNLFDVQFSPILMKKMWQMMAHWQSQIINLEDISRSLSVGATTVKRYFDFLEGAFIIHRLPPFYVNINKRLVKSPKLYILDSGMLHRLLHITSNKELAGHPFSGASWEAYVVSQLIYNMPGHLTAYFYRTHTGAECDVVLAQGHIIKYCIEIKLGK
ncbi:MAG TPA: ATP-binding protein, partial [Bacteroidia bacterium]|nr:ATP-binding protein [Bacteroidia bacterium]